MKSYEQPSGRCRFGTATADITPPVGIYHRMWGAATHERSEGVHRPLRATAVALSPSTTSGDSTSGQVILSLDHCLFGAPEIDRLLDDVAAGANCRRDEISVLFSHTHGAGLMSLDRRELPGGELIPDYLREVGRRSAELVRTARETAAEATLTYGRGRCGLATHRDLWDDERRQFVCGFDPSAAADDELWVVRATDDGGRTLGVLVNYACHPTTLAWENRLISPDFPGAMREVVERATGAPCLFIQGASGELGPRDGFVGDPEVADRNGRRLGYAALEVLEAMTPPDVRYRYVGPVVSGATIGVWSYEPLDANRQRERAAWSERRWESPLDWRPDLPTLDGVRADRERWRTEEAAAKEAGRDERARECRAMVERQDRMLARLEQMPRTAAYPLEVRLTRIGDGLWAAVPGEHYSWLQRGLRMQFPGRPVIVATLLNGWGPSYVPTADAYGRGIYQETIAVVAAGSLEKLVTEIGRAGRELLGAVSG